MSALEILARAHSAYRQILWFFPALHPDPFAHLLPEAARRAHVVLQLPTEPGAAGSPPALAAIAAARRLLAGHWPVFELEREDFGIAPDWFRDPLTGSRTPEGVYAFRIRHRDEAVVGNLKYLLESSRHQATTLLAAAWWLTRDDVFAERAAAHLASWWAANPFPTGIHWTSVYEAGLRLLAWTWTRALLSDWAGCEALFDANDTFIRQLYFHQLVVLRLHSRGSSSNNHVLTEMAGLAVSAAAFPWFTQSEAWSGWGYRRVVEEAELQIAADGLDREHAADYHRLVLEVLLASTMAGELAGRPFPAAIYDICARMSDALAAMLDTDARPPRYGDADDGHAVLLDAPEADGYHTVLDASAALFGRARWWPAGVGHGSVLGVIATALRPSPPSRPGTAAAPVHFAESGQTFMHGASPAGQVWLRCDHAPLGYLSIAAHGHADALSFELRLGGRQILIDPGTFRYQCPPEWRRYFKGTLAHNTWMVDGEDQAVFGGSFLWMTATTPVLEALIQDDDAESWVWQARHDGYRRLPDPVTHHRRIALDRAAGGIQIVDWIEAGAAHDIAMPLHLGPGIETTLDGPTATLRWGTLGGTAALDLPAEFTWSSHRGETVPPLGWMSRRFGEREPITTLVGRGRVAPGTKIVTSFSIGGASDSP